MIHHKMASAPAHVPPRYGRRAGAAVAGRDGSGPDRHGADSRQPGAPPGLCLHSHGHERGGMDARRAKAGSPICRRRWPRSCRSWIKSRCSRISSSGTRIPPATMRRRTARSSAARRPRGPKAATTSWARRSIRSPRKHIGKDTPLPSLELGTDLIAQVGNCDNGFACAYQNNLSWSSPTTPLPTEADPARRLRTPVRRRGQPRPPARRAAQERQHSGLDDRRHGSPATGARRRRPNAG